MNNKVILGSCLVLALSACSGSQKTGAKTAGTEADAETGTMGGEE